MNEEILLNGLKMFIKSIVAETVAELGASHTLSVEELPSHSHTQQQVAVEEVATETVIEDAELDLSNLTYNDLKKLAKDLGVSVKGSRETIEKAILASGYSVTAEAVEEPEEEVIAEEEEEVVAEDPKDSVEAEIRETLEDMSDEEIKDLLTENGIKSKGKREALIQAVIKAVKDGSIPFEDEEDTEEVEEAEVVEEPIEEEEDTTETPEEEVLEMTPEREKAVKKVVDEFLADYEKGEYDKAELKGFVQELYQEDIEDEEEIVNAYLDYLTSFIDDDGVTHEEQDPYILNGEAYCCGAPLELDDDLGGKCAFCGGEYSFADED